MVKIRLLYLIENDPQKDKVGAVEPDVWTTPRL
jgi:hypothetical protein